MKQKSVRYGYFLVIAAGTMWGFSDSCGQYLFSRYPMFSSISLTVIRGLIGGIIMCTVNFFRDRKSFIGIWKDRKDALQLIVLGIFGLMLSQYTTFRAIQVTNAGTATVLQELSPVFILVFTCTVGRRLPKKTELIAVLLAVLGTFLLATHGRLSEMALTPEGLFWGVSSGATAAAYTLLSRRITEKWGSQTVMSFALLIDGIVLLLLTQAWQYPVALGIDGWLAIGGVLLFGTLFTYAMYVGGCAIIGPVKGGLLACMEPLVACLLAALWLGTDFAWIDLLGFACILATVCILTLKRETSQKQHSDSP